jgi:UDP-glucuronate 4-epimerase
MPERVLVTGAAGFIGSHVVEALLARADTVLGLDNFDPFYDEATKRENLREALRSPGFRFEQGDIRSAETVSRLIVEFRPDAIVHLAARAGVRPSIQHPALYADVNVVGTTVILEAARQAAVNRIVVASSSSVYGDSSTPPFRESEPAISPVSPYAATKRAAELVCDTYSSLYAALRILSLRFFTVYGPRQRPDLAIHKFTRLLLAGQPIPYFGDGSFARDYTYVTDTVEGVLGAVDRTKQAGIGHEIYNLGECATTTLSELVALLEAATGRRATLDRQPEQPGDVRRTFADISLARERLGYRPSVPIADGIPRFVAWYRDHHSRPPVSAGAAN